MDTKKISHANNVIDFHADAKSLLQKNSEKRSALVRPEIIRGLAQPSRKIDFLSDQLGSAKNELSMFRQNHNAMVEQIVFIQKDFKRRLRKVSEEKTTTEAKFKKVTFEYNAKAKESEFNSKKLEELKSKFNQLHSAYSTKIEKFKEQHKSRIQDKELTAEKKIRTLAFDKEKLQKDANYLMDIIQNRNKQIVAFSSDVKIIREEAADLKIMNEALAAFKKENEQTVASLNGEMSVLKVDLADTVKAQREKEKEAEVLKYKLSSVTDDSKNLKTKVEELQQKVFDLRSSVEGKRAKIDAYEQTIADLRSAGLETGKLSDEIRNYQILEASLRGEIQALKQKEDQYRGKIKEQSQHLIGYEEKIEFLNEEVLTAQSSFEKSKKNFEDQIQKLEDQNIDLGKRESKLVASMEQVKITLADKDKTIAEQRKQGAEARQEFKEESEARQLIEQRLFEVETLEKEQALEITELKSGVAVLRTGVETKDGKLDELNLKLDEFEDKSERLSIECATLEDHIAELSQELKAAGDHNQASLGSINSFNEKVTSLSGEIFDLKEEKESLGDQIDGLNNEIDLERMRYKTLEADLDEQLKQLEEAKNKEVDFIEAKQDWSDAKEALELRIEDFTNQISDKEEEFLAKQNEIDTITREMRGLQSDFDTAQKTISDMDVEKLEFIRGRESLVSKNESLSYLKSQLEVETKDKGLMIEKLSLQVDNFEKKGVSLNQDIESLEKRIAEFGETSGAQMSELRDEAEFLKKQRQDYLFEKKDRELEIKELHAALEKAKADFMNAKKETQSFKDKVADTANMKSMVEGDKQDLIQKLEMQNLKFVDLEKSFEDEKGRSESLEVKIQSGNDKIYELETLNQNHEVSIASHRDLKEKLEVISAKEENFDEEITKRREELDLYSRWVDSQKESLKNHIVRFTQELKLSLTINPLHSYLAMTEKELNKVEMLLSKPGVLGAQRTHLEEHHQVLADQKRYIGELVEKTKKDVDKRADEVMGLLKQGEFIPVPPLPPIK